MNIILAFFLLLFSSLASAATYCAPYGYAGDITFAPTNIPAAMSCLPRPLGDSKTSTFSNVVATSAGFVEWHYCSDGYVWKLEWEACTSAACAAAVPQLVAALGTSDPMASINAVVAATTTLYITDNTLLPIWCPSYAAMLKGQPQNVPYVVKPNGAQATRATFALAAGTRSKTPNGVIYTQTAGFPTSCDCSRPVWRSVEGNDTYCAVRSTIPTGATVALCTPR